LKNTINRHGTEDFVKHAKIHSALTDDELEQIKAASIPKKLRKKQFLLQEGDTCRTRAFVCKGCLRVYRVSIKGTEHILHFAAENWWIDDPESLLTGQPSKTNIEAIEDCELLLWKKEDMEKLFTDIPVFKTWNDHTLAKNLISHQNRIYSDMSETAEMKYNNFIEAYPSIYNRVPLHMVASYLGVSAKTLTRIRKHSTGQ
jgi:CRP-like cAMP-binding protein